MVTKTRKPKTEQKRIEGTYEPLPKELEVAVDDYVATLRKRMATQKDEDTLRSEVLDLMATHNIDSVPLDDDESLTRVHKDESWKLKIVKKAQSDS